MICRNISSCSYAHRDRNFFLSLLKKATTLSHLTQTHAQVILNGYQNDVVTVTKLTHKFSDLKAIRHARDLVFSFPRPDLFLFNVLIKGFATNASPFSSISLYTHLRKSTTLCPDKYTYAFAISAASGLRDELYGVLLHAHSVVDGLGSNLYVGSILVDFYFKFSRVEIAQKVFDEMPEKDTVLWNTMVSGLLRNCYYVDAVRVFRDMVVGGNGFDSTTLATLLPAVAELQELKAGTWVQCLAVKVGFHDDVHVLTGLVSLYSKCGELGTARMVFGMIGEPDLVCYNAMIAGYTCSNETVLAVGLFKELLGYGEKVNSSTIVGLVPVSSPFGHLQLTRSLQSFCVKSGIVSHPSVSTALVTVYCRLNEIESARQLFDESAKRTLASWNAMISGYTQNGLTETAISLFREMMSEFSPNPVTVTTILSACAQLGALSLGKWVHGLIKSKNLESNIYVLTALVDMYAKCGSIAEARQLFDLMTEKNVVTWNAMISGYGLHGDGHEALKLFNEMLDSGIPPSGVSFLSVLYACSHAGLVREGDEIFHKMVHNHQFVPISEHYACMVDIFGRAGQLEKALEFIKKMPVEPGSAVWGALLGACKIHKDTKLARLASEKLLELDPDNTGYYVLLSNILSADGNFPKAASVRQVAKHRNLAKTPGCTLVEIGDTPHVFTCGDRSHPQATEIYKMLDKLTGKMREAGFQTETGTALHDVEEEEKELMVNVHSEKLAIAFALISTAPGTEIRIIKNLRTVFVLVETTGEQEVIQYWLRCTMMQASSLQFILLTDFIICKEFVSSGDANFKKDKRCKYFQQLIPHCFVVGPLVFNTNGSIRTQSKEKIEARSTDHMTTIVGVRFCLPIRPLRNGYRWRITQKEKKSFPNRGPHDSYPLFMASEIPATTPTRLMIKIVVGGIRRVVHLKAYNSPKSSSSADLAVTVKLVSIPAKTFRRPWITA